MEANISKFQVSDSQYLGNIKCVAHRCVLHFHSQYSLFHWPSLSYIRTGGFCSQAKRLRPLRRMDAC